MIRGPSGAGATVTWSAAGDSTLSVRCEGNISRLLYARRRFDYPSGRSGERAPPWEPFFGLLERGFEVKPILLAQNVRARERRPALMFGVEGFEDRQQLAEVEDHAVVEVDDAVERAEELPRRERAVDGDRRISIAGHRGHRQEVGGLPQLGLRVDEEGVVA